MPQSAISYFADMVASTVAATALSMYALTHFAAVELIEWALLAVVGVLAWTFTEYIIHRFVYHRVPCLKTYHLVHHEYPQAYVGAPPLLGTGMLFLMSFFPASTYSDVLASALSAGMLAGYACYMMVHHACHHWMPVPGSFLYRARLRHVAHHYRREDGNFGVTTSVWDHAFRTHIKPFISLRARPIGLPAPPSYW
jgi:sterol desaturase/sphingolipid hydroxylase (fatty acid hydroxylase superfamily)